MSRTEKGIALAILLVFFIVFLQTAWVGDDAYITLRTLDNFVNGYGLRWNVAERVQSFTHPLWLAAMLPVYFVTRNPYLTAVAVSFVFSLAALVLILSRLNYRQALPVVSVLLASKAFVDFSVSGLENPATHLLLVLFIFRFYRAVEWNDRDFLLLGLYTGLGLLNRMDAVLFFVPALVYAVYRRPTPRAFVRLALGLTPFLAWELFSTFYYGFPFPNTAYAKLNTDLTSLALLRQAGLYFFDSLERDPITLVVIFSVLVLVVWRGSTRERVLAIGIVLYLLYILKIGGDFMSGRFFSAALLVAVLLGQRLLKPAPRSVRYALSMLAILLGFFAPYPTFLPHDPNQPLFREADLLTGIQDERGFYYHITGLPTVAANDWKLPDSEGWVEHGLALRASGKSVAVENNIGFVGYYAGPEVYLVDLYALSDPLLARLPLPAEQAWRIGHFERPLPEGYLATLRTGENKLVDPGLAAYFDKLSLIIRGPLWSRERFKAIWEINTGQADDLLKGAQ